MIEPYTRKYASAHGQNLLPPDMTMRSPVRIGTLAAEGSSDPSPSVSSTDGSPLWLGWSRITKAHAAARIRVTTPRTRNTSLHPSASASMLSGPDAAIAPTLPTAMTMPLSTAKSDLGNHTEMSFMSGT